MATNRTEADARALTDDANGESRAAAGCCDWMCDELMQERRIGLRDEHEQLMNVACGLDPSLT